MSSDEARKIVKDGLDRLRAEQTQREAAMDAQERSLRVIINENHTMKTLTEFQQLERQKEVLRKQLEEQEREVCEMVAKDDEAQNVTNKYGIFCICMILLAAVTRLSIFVLLATILGTTVIFVIRVCKIYGLV